MDVLALFSDGTAERILIDTFPKKESEKGLIIRTSISSRVLKESAVKSIQNTCLLFEKNSIEFKDDFAICIYGFSNTVIGNSADLGFAIAFTNFLITRGYLPNKKTLFSRIAATGVVDDRLNIRAVNDIKKKILAAIENNANVVYFPEENLKEIEDLTKNNTEFCELLKRITLVPVKTLEEVFSHLGILKGQINMVKKSMQNLFPKVSSPLGKVLLHLAVLLPILTIFLLSYSGFFQNQAKEGVTEPITTYPAVSVTTSSPIYKYNVQAGTIAPNTTKITSTPTFISLEPNTPKSTSTSTFISLAPNTPISTSTSTFISLAPTPIITPTTAPIKTIEQTSDIPDTPTLPNYLPTPTIMVSDTGAGIITAPIPPIEIKGVVLYENINCEGNFTQNFFEGDYTLRDLTTNNTGFVDNWASSVYIPWGYTVQLFDDNMLKSSILNHNHWLLNANYRCSRDFTSMANANDEVSSIRVRYGVTFYENNDLYGSCSMGFGVGKYTLNQLESRGFIDNWASSVTIPEEWYVIMYEDDNFTGRSWRLDYFDHNCTNFVNIEANNAISSIEVGFIEPE